MLLVGIYLLIGMKISTMQFLVIDLIRNFKDHLSCSVRNLL